MVFLPPEVAGLSVALGIGLLVGLERERAKRRGARADQAGVRTFALLSLTGATAALIGPPAIYVAGFFVAAVATLKHAAAEPADAGLTTEVAMVVTFLLGLLALPSPAIAGGAGVVVAILLASRRRLHRLSRQWLTESELGDLLMLAAAAFVIMPLLPDRAIDPWGAINPRRLWMLAVAIMAIASLGYLSLRLLGPRFGLLVAGLAGGFVSSTATVAAMGDRAKHTPTSARLAIAAALISNVGTLVQMGIVVAALSPSFARQLAVPLSLSAGAAIALSIAAGWHASAGAEPISSVDGGRPFELGAVLRFVALLGAIMLVVAVARERLGDTSLPWVMVVSGIADVHAAGASLAQAVAGARLDPDTAARSMTAAIVANGILKCGLAAWRGGARFALGVVPGVAAIVAVFAASVFVAR